MLRIYMDGCSDDDDDDVDIDGVHRIFKRNDANSLKF